MRGPAPKGSQAKRCSCASRWPRKLRRGEEGAARQRGRPGLEPAALRHQQPVGAAPPPHHRSPLRVEAQRVVPHRGRAVQRVGGHEHHVACGHREGW